MMLLLNLKKHAQQDNMKVLGVKLIMLNNYCLLQKKAKQMLWPVSFGLIMSEHRKILFVLYSILEFCSLKLTTHRI